MNGLKLVQQNKPTIYTRRHREHFNVHKTTYTVTMSGFKKSKTFSVIESVNTSPQDEYFYAISSSPKLPPVFL